MKLLTQAANFGSNGIQPASDAFSKGSAVRPDTAVNNVELFISNMIGLLTIVAGLFFVFYFIMGGLNWITAGGEQGKIEKARDQMVQSVIGMVVIVISYGLMGIIGKFLGIDILQPGNTFLMQLDPTK
jgi:cytochrome bd-type quinol oxidase subunit 2